MDMQPERPSLASITLTEAKKRLRSGHPLVGQLVRGSFSMVIELGGKVKGNPEDFDAIGEWRVCCYPEVKSPQKYDDGGLRLRAALIPWPCNGKSLKRLLPRVRWDEIRTGILTACHERCAVCGDTARLSCHEVWLHDDALGIQKLIRLETVCGLCHFIDHLGLAETLAERGELDFNSVVVHFCTVNDCNVKAFVVHRTRAMDEWRRRSKMAWRIDFGPYASLVSEEAKGPHQPRVVRILTAKEMEERRLTGKKGSRGFTEKL